MKNKKIFIFLLLAFLLTSSGLGCQQCQAPATVTLEFWGVWDSPEQMNTLIAAYRQQHPSIAITYRQFRYEEYERKLLEAFADDRGPDIYMIPVAWIKKYQSRLVPVPSSIANIPYGVVTTSMGKQKTCYESKTMAGLTPSDIKRKFVPVVYNNVVKNNAVYGLPFYVDTMVTFYNRDLLFKANIAQPMTDFTTLVTQVPKLSRVTTDNKIVQSAESMPISSIGPSREGLIGMNGARR